MATPAIPRFLLPQLTWKASTILAPRLIIPSVSQQRNTPPRRGVSSQTASRNEHQIPQRLAIPKPPNHQNYVHRPSLLTRLSPPPTSPPSARPFSTTPISYRDHHFDTLKFVQRLRDEGFSEEQATALMRVLSDVIEESIQNLTRTMVLREDAERSTYTQKVDFTKLRSELLSSDSTETLLTRASHERLTNELAKLNSRLRDEIARTQASVRLDLNLEKGRIREEANVQELKIKETETRIEQEVAGLRERVEGVKFSTLQWLM
ncbi:MAG: hypothetical protein MMC33_006440 [Icmadophila ericetorum]|nr:hypothetical protein [Icmadophila ericetorum]